MLDDRDLTLVDILLTNISNVDPYKSKRCLELLKVITP